MSRYRTIDMPGKRLVCRDEKFMSAHEIVEELQDLEQRLDAAEARLDAGEALLNRMSMNLILSGYSPELDKNNPMNDWLGRVVEWKKARLECPKQEEVEGK